jgi:UDP-3-O-[3-hydroxymyristoyl] glucosamine N-acyltransferase
MRDIPDGGKSLGTPAQPDRQAKRQIIALQLLPDLIRRVQTLEKLVSKKK